MCTGIVLVVIWCSRIVTPLLILESVGGDFMSTLKAYGYSVVSIFQLIGDKENDITKSIAWAFSKCPVFMKKVFYEVFRIDVNPNDVNILYQNYYADMGITDIEVIDGQTFYLIIEAKRGWLLPGYEQFTKYSLRSDFLERQKYRIRLLYLCQSEVWNMQRII